MLLKVGDHQCMKPAPTVNAVVSSKPVTVDVDGIRDDAECEVVAAFVQRRVAQVVAGGMGERADAVGAVHADEVAGRDPGRLDLEARIDRPAPLVGRMIAEGGAGVAKPHAVKPGVLPCSRWLGPFLRLPRRRTVPKPG